jgi:hypothetical protein
VKQWPDYFRAATSLQLGCNLRANHRNELGYKSAGHRINLVPDIFMIEARTSGLAVRYRRATQRSEATPWAKPAVLHQAGVPSAAA